MTTTDQDVLMTMKFCRGLGTKNKSGCWGAMLNLWAGGVRWEASHACIDPIINRMCIRINDALSDKNRTAVIMDFGPLDPLGTAGDKAATERRAYRLIDAALRDWYPEMLRKVGALVGDAAKRAELVSCAGLLRAQNPIVDELTRKACIEPAKRARRAAIAIAIASDIASAIASASASDIAIAIAIASASASDIAIASASASDIAIASASDSDIARDRFIVERVLPVLRELIEMGPHAPVERVCEARKLQTAMGLGA